MPASAVDVASLIQRILLPGALDRVIGFGDTGDHRAADLALHDRTFGVLRERRQVAPGRFHHRLARQEQGPALAQGPAYLLARAVGQELDVTLQRAEMSLRVDQRLHRLRIEVEIPVVGRADIRRRERQEMEEALCVDFGVQRQPPVVGTVAVPVPAGEKVGDVVHLRHRRRRDRQIVAVLGFELRLILRVLQHVLAVIEHLCVGVEQHAIQLAPPAIQPAHRRHEIVGVPGRVLGVGQERFDRHNVRRSGGEEVAIEPGCGHVRVVAMQAAGEIGEDLRVEDVDRNGGDADAAAGFFLPVRDVVVQTVADRALFHQQVDGLAFVRLGLEEGDPLRGDRRFVWRLGGGLEQTGGGGARAQRRQRGRGDHPAGAADKVAATQRAGVGSAMIAAAHGCLLRRPVLSPGRAKLSRASAECQARRGRGSRSPGKSWFTDRRLLARFVSWHMIPKILRSLALRRCRLGSVVVAGPRTGYGRRSTSVGCEKKTWMPGLRRA